MRNRPSASLLAVATAARSPGRVTVSRTDSGLSGHGDALRTMRQPPSTMVRPWMPDSDGGDDGDAGAAGEPAGPAQAAERITMRVEASKRYRILVGRLETGTGSGGGSCAARHRTIDQAFRN